METSPHTNAAREMDRSTATSESPTFRPAEARRMDNPRAQVLNHLDMAWRNRLSVDERDLAVLHSLPTGAGILLASNHADETDLKVCLELRGAVAAGSFSWRTERRSTRASESRAGGSSAWLLFRGTRWQ